MRLSAPRSRCAREGAGMKTAPITIRDDGKCGIIRAEKEFFERDCILRVVSEYAPACFISFYPDSETSIEICIRTKDGSVITEALLRQFFNDCIDAQIRIDLEKEFGPMRRAIVEYAFRSAEKSRV